MRPRILVPKDDSRITTPKRGLFGLLPHRLQDKLLPALIGDRLGGTVNIHTLLTAQKYEVDWHDLESAFPMIKHFPDTTQQWGYLKTQFGIQGTDDPEMWEFFNRSRSIREQPRRRVKDRLMTTAFVDFIVDQLQTETSEFGDFKFHQCGLGVTNENITDTGIETDTGIGPETGTQTETDHDTYKSVATFTMDATEAITEHVLMSQSGAGTCMDRTEFAIINVVSGNQIEFTFEGSFTAGG